MQWSATYVCICIANPWTSTAARECACKSECQGSTTIFYFVNGLRSGVTICKAIAAVALRRTARPDRSFAGVVERGAAQTSFCRKNMSYRETEAGVGSATLTRRPTTTVLFNPVLCRQEKHYSAPVLHGIDRNPASLRRKPPPTPVHCETQPRQKHFVSQWFAVNNLVFTSHHCVTAAQRP